MHILFLRPHLKILCFTASFILLQRVYAQYDFTETNHLLDTYQHQLGNNVAAIIWKDGKTIYKKELGNFTVNTEVPVASCSKWLTAALVMTFVDEGRLSLDDSVGKYLPLFTQYGKGSIKIKDCLSHTTGLESPSVTLLSLIGEYRKREHMISLEEEVNDFARNRKLIAKPGTEFRYSNIGLNVAGHIVEVISGKNFEKIFQERIAIPLGMLHTSFAKGKGPANPSGGAYSTANDYTNFLAMILDKGVHRGKRVLSEKAVAEMERSRITLAMVKYAPDPADGYTYALGEWVEETDQNGSSTAVASPGLFGTWPLVDICHQYACIFLVKIFLSKKQRDIYLRIKQSIDSQMISTCLH